MVVLRFDWVEGIERTLLAAGEERERSFVFSASDRRIVV
jgi:hypothetical protein